MKKILFALVFGGIFIASTSAMAYTIGIGADMQMGEEMYKLYSSTPGSTEPFTWGPTNGETLVPAIYPSVHLILGEENGLLDIGVGKAEGNIIPISIGGLHTYWKFTNMFKLYGGGDITYYVVPNSAGWTYLKLNSTIVGLEISLPVIPLSAYAGAGVKFPMVFGPDSYFAMGFGWQVNCGARFYLMR